MNTNSESTTHENQQQGQDKLQQVHQVQKAEAQRKTAWTIDFSPPKAAAKKTILKLDGSGGGVAKTGDRTKQKVGKSYPRYTPMSTLPVGAC